MAQARPLLMFWPMVTNGSSRALALLPILAALVGLPACGDDEGAGAGGGGGATTGSTTTGGEGGATTGNTTTGGEGGATTGAGGAGGAPGPGEPGIFACELSLSCEEMSFHTSAFPPEAMQCSAELAVSGEPGVLLAASVPGPYNTRTEHLVVLLGDGTALTQSRHKSCMDCDFDALPWEDATELQLCDVVITEELAGACEDGTEECSVWPLTLLSDSCEVVPEPNCADLDALLGATE